MRSVLPGEQVWVGNASICFPSGSAQHSQRQTESAGLRICWDVTIPNFYQNHLEPQTVTVES